MRFLKNIYHFLLSIVGSIIYGNPSKNIFVIGVTGTKGKTTTIELINAGLEAAGHKTALSSSFRRKIGDQSDYSGGNTMPGRFFLQRFLKNAVKAGCRYAIIEVTSEGVKQHRHRGIDFNAAVFLNLHPEHIESHGSFQAYRDAKAEFFRYVKNISKKKPKYFFVNQGDENHKYFEEAASGELTFLYGKSELRTHLIGEFNKANVGAAENVLKTIGVSEDAVGRAFANFKGVPGRMEFLQERPFAVVIDYAHTPDSLEQVYKALRSWNSAGDLVCVLSSAGGGRDKWKRPKMGEVAAKYCQKIIVTNEDPYDEIPEAIINDVKAGATKAGRGDVISILDRREAIRTAIGSAESGNTVVITGKGSEPYMHVGKHKTIPWSDKNIVLDALKEVGL